MNTLINYANWLLLTRGKIEPHELFDINSTSALFEGTLEECKQKANELLYG